MMMNDNNQEKENNESSESQVSSPVGTVLNAPKYGIVVPNRVFVGGISSQTTENDLTELFSSYGNVVNTKIIADRAGVSKGYGFVTFATTEEAMRLQNDADSIVLRERRLNIAPAIKKQTYQRPSYDGGPPVPGSPVPMTSGQMYRQPGVPFFQNGMAFYAPVGAPTPQPPQTMTPVQSPVEAPHVYPPGAYGGVAQNTTAPNYTTFSYPNPIYYQAPYPYHLACNGLGYVGHPEGMTGQIQPAYLEGYPVSDGTHVAPNNVIIPAAGGESGGVLFAASPYIFAQQPGTQHQQYFDPQNISPMQQAAAQEPGPQVFYSTARGYEPPTFVYTESGNSSSTGGSASLASTPVCVPPPTSEATQEPNLAQQEPRRFHPLHYPDVGIGSSRGRPPRGRGRGGPGRGGTKPYPVPSIPAFPGKALTQNNNDPKCYNRNSLTFTNRKHFGFYPPRSVRNPENPPNYPNPSPNPLIPSFPNSSNRSSPQVPAMSYIPGMRPHYGIQLPINPHFSSPRRGGPAYRGSKYQCGRGGKTMKGQSWSYREATDSAEEGSVLANALTPPITPRSPHDPTEELSASLQGLNI